MNTKTKSSLIIRLSLILAALLFSTDQASAKDKGDWWMEAEDKASTVTNRDGIIDIVAPKGLTLWNTNLMQENTVIEYEARIVSDPRFKDDKGNNRISDLNCFWMAERCGG